MSKVPYKSCFRDAYVSPRTIKMLQITSWRVLNVPIYRQVRWDPFPGPRVKWWDDWPVLQTPQTPCVLALPSPRRPFPPRPLLHLAVPVPRRSLPWACCSSHSTCCSCRSPRESPCAGKSLPVPLGPLFNCFNPMNCTPYPQTVHMGASMGCNPVFRIWLWSVYFYLPHS